ncbi:MAG: hypothetical protein ABJB74_13575 [Gemmatimonas sp.]
MTRSVANTRTTRRFVVTLLASVSLASVALTACHSDDVVGTNDFVECIDQPGCQTEMAPVAASVIPALDDATSRAAVGLSPTARGAISTTIAKLETALVARDIARGRLALTAVLDAITTAERADPASLADLGVIRLGLAPAARSLGLPFSAIEAVVN